MTIDLNLVPVFLAVAEEGKFRAAADRLGVTRSAVSQVIRRLEDICGIALVSRTTRSVRLTEAGNRFRETLAQPIADVKSALENVAGDARPSGLLRIAVTSVAEQFLSGPLIASFAEAHPGITIDVTVTDDIFDIVAAGFDAGVRLGEVIEQDMVAVPLTNKEREVVVATPRYFEIHGMPRHPRELVRHRCIGWRPSPSAAPYRWEFEEAGITFDVAVDPQITTNNLQLMFRTALAGGGITFALEETFRPYIDRGDLITALDEYLPPFPGVLPLFPQSPEYGA
jgi:DNA-binding transcriptional LysR family regulator